MKVRIALFLIVWLFAMSIFTDSLPEAIGGLLAGIITVAVIVIWGYIQIQRGFNVRYSVDPLHFDMKRVKSRQHSKVWECKTGKRELLLRVMPNRGTSFNKIGLAFVDKNIHYFPYPKNIDVRSKIDRVKPRFVTWTTIKSPNMVIDEIIDLDTTQTKGRISHTIESWHDGTSRVWLEYQPPYFRTRDDSLWLQVRFSANQEWDGYMQFTGDVSQDNRASNRLRIKVSESPSKDMSDYNATEGML